MFSQYGPRHAQGPSSYQYPPANQTRFENTNQNGPDARSSTGRDYGSNSKPKVFNTGPNQSNRTEVLKQENIKTPASSNALEDLKKTQNKDVVIKVTELGTESRQSAVGNVELPTAGTIVLRTTAPDAVDTYIVETVTANFVAGNQESNVQSLVDKSGCKIAIVPHADPLLQEVTVSDPDISRPEVIDELRRLSTEFGTEETRGAGDAEAGIQRLLETVRASSTNTTVLMGEQPRSHSSIRLEDIGNIPLDSRATMQGSENFEDGIEISAEDIRGSTAYVQKPKGENLSHAELGGAGNEAWAVLKANAQTAADALKGKRAPESVIEDGSSLYAAFADTSATSNSSQRKTLRSGNIHRKNAPRNDSIISMASADESVGSKGNTRRTLDEAEPSEVFYTPDEDSRLSSRSRGSGRGPGKMNAKAKKEANSSTDMPNQASNLSLTSAGDEPGSYAAIDDPSEADQQFMLQTMNSQPSSMSIHSTGSTTKRKKKKPKSRKKESVEGSASLSIATDGGEGNSTMSFASAADVSAQGSSTSFIHSSDPAADINKAAAETTPESWIARGRRIRREDREMNGGRKAVEPPNVPGRPHQWPTPGMSLGNRPAAQSFGGQDSLPMMQTVWRASGRRDSMTATGCRQGPANLIPGMTPYPSCRPPPPPSQTQHPHGPAHSDSGDSIGMSMANAAWRASLPNSTPGLDPYPTVRLPPPGSQMPQSTTSSTNTNNGTRPTINVSVTRYVFGVSEQPGPRLTGVLQSFDCGYEEARAYIQSMANGKTVERPKIPGPGQFGVVR